MIEDDRKSGREPSTVLSEVEKLLGGARVPQCESPSLRLEKFARIGGNTKKQEIDAVVACHAKHAQRIPAWPVLPPGSITFTASLEARLIINQAGGALENAGLCLHRHFGDPIIPGSAVKGIARHAAWREWHAETDESRKSSLAERIVRVFGYPSGDRQLDEHTLKAFELAAKAEAAMRRAADNPQLDQAGLVSFLQAVPEAQVRLATDIVNCHHSRYYADTSGSATATDNEGANPQFFLAVDAKTEFRFTLIPSGRARQGGQDALEDARRWLVAAITVYGAGAKTAAGYGWFLYDEAAEARKAQLAAEREARQKKEEEQRQQEENRRIQNIREKERCAQMTPEARADEEVAQWKDDKLRDKMRKFHDPRRGPDEDEKAAVVRALRGNRQALWDAFKTEALKGELAKAADAIRKTSKEMGWGKMP